MTGIGVPGPDEALARATVRVGGPGGTSGAGLLLAHDLVITCAHVVSDALGQPREMAVTAGTYVEVALPLSGDADPSRTAAVERWIPTRPNQTGDVAVLRLTESIPENAQARPLPMANPESVLDHPATAVGFTAGDPGETWFRGRFGGPTSEGWIQLSRADGETTFVGHGFSGSPAWDNDLGAVVGLMVAAQPEQATQQAYVLRTRTLLEEVPELVPSALPPSPFRGLAPFRESDASVFFGRDDDITDVVRALEGDRSPITMYGPSGSGKSSLVLAGVLPRMRDDGWDALVINAGQISSPRSALATELYELARAEDSMWARTSSADDVEDLLVRKGLPDTLHRMRGGSDGKLLVVLDQAEALLEREESEIAEAVDLLFPERPADGIRVLVTLRSDLMDTFLAHPRLGPALRRGQTLPLTPMSRDQLADVISRPLEGIPAVTYEPGLAARILRDAGSEPGALPLLGFVLERLWENQTAGHLRSTAYDAMGGVSGALRQYAEQAWQTCTAGHDDADARRLLTGLVRMLPGGEVPLRRRLTRAEAGEERWRIVQRLAEKRLLVLRGGEHEPETAELAHDALITAWPALDQQVKEDTDFLAARAELGHDRERWESSERSPDLLPGPVQLAALHQGLGEREPELTEAEREFLLAARRRQRTRRARARGAWTAAALVLALIAGLGTFGVYQAQVSAEREAEARSRALANFSDEFADSDPERSAAMAIAAYEVAPTQEAQNALLHSYDRLENADFVLSGVQGSIRAVATSSDGRVALATTETGRATLFLRRDDTVVRRQLDLDVNATVPLVSNDGTRIGYLSSGGRAPIWHELDRPTRTNDILGPAHRPDADFTAHSRAESSAAAPRGIADFSPDGTRIAAVDENGEILLWDLESGEREKLPEQLPSAGALWFGPDRNTVLIQEPVQDFDNSETSVAVLDLTTGETRRLSDRVDLDYVASMTLSGNGQVASFCIDGDGVATLRTVRVATGETLNRYREPYASCPVEATLDETGRHLAVQSMEHWTLVDTRSGKQQEFTGPPLDGFTYGGAPASASGMPLLGTARDPVVVTWNGSAITGWEGKPGGDIELDSPPVLLDDGRKMLAHLSSKRLALMDIRKGLTGTDGRPRLLGSAERQKGTAAKLPSPPLQTNRSETLAADVVDRNRVVIHELPSLRTVAKITTDRPFIKKDKEATGANYFFLDNEEFVTRSGFIVERWDARTGRRLAPPLDLRKFDFVGGKVTPDEIFAGSHPKPGHLGVNLLGEPFLHLIDLRTGKESRQDRLRFDGDLVNVRHNQEGTYAAVLTTGSLVELWRTPEGEQPKRVMGPIGPLRGSRWQAGFSGEAEFFLAMGDGIRFLTAPPENTRFYNFESSQKYLAASSDGKRLLRLVGDGSVVDLLRLSPERWRDHLCDVVGRDLDKSDRRGMPVPMPDPICKS